MTKEQILQKNLSLLHLRFPRIALQMQLTSPQRSEEEKSLSFSERDLPNGKEGQLYVVGWEGGIDAALLKKWTLQSSKRRVVFVVTSFDRAVNAFSRWGYEDLFSLQEIKWVSLDDSLHQIIWEWGSLPLFFLNLSRAGTSFGAACARAISLVRELKWEEEGVLSAYRDFGVGECKNLFLNLVTQPKRILGDTLKKGFSSIPAIICGAGPSLEKELDMLQSLHQQALIFGAGSASSCLEREGIVPHFSVAVDPIFPKERTFRREEVCVPFIYQEQVCPDLLTALHGEVIAMPSSASSPLQQAILSSLGISPFSFEAGWNVATFAAHVASFWGCNPLIFVGMDGVVEKEQQYAQGASWEDETMQRRDFSSIFIEQGERRVQSKIDFFLGKKWLEDWMQAHPSLQCIKIGDEGLHIEGMSYSSLKKVKEQFLGKKWDLKGLMHRMFVQSREIVVSFDSILRELDHLQASIASCLKACECYLGGLLSSSLEKKGERMVTQIELEEEWFWQTVLSPMWNIWRFRLMPLEKQEDRVAERRVVQQMVFWRQICYRYLEMFHKIPFWRKNA